MRSAVDRRLTTLRGTSASGGGPSGTGVSISSSSAVELPLGRGQGGYPPWPRGVGHADMSMAETDPVFRFMSRVVGVGGRQRAGVLAGGEERGGQVRVGEGRAVTVDRELAGS